MTIADQDYVTREEFLDFARRIGNRYFIGRIVQWTEGVNAQFEAKSIELQGRLTEDIIFTMLRNIAIEMMHENSIWGPNVNLGSFETWEPSVSSMVNSMVKVVRYTVLSPGERIEISHITWKAQQN